jgi:hypothetical protein
MQAKGGPFTVAVNIQSVDGSEVLYAIEEEFAPPDLAGLLALPMGMTKLESKAVGLALDYVRSTVGGNPMITKAQMTLLPQAGAKAKGQGGGADDSAGRRRRRWRMRVTLLNMTIADKDGVIYAFGSRLRIRGRWMGFTISI